MRDALTYASDIVEHFDAVSTIGVFSWLDDPPASFREGLGELEVLLVLKDVLRAAFLSWQLNNICLRHDRPRVIIQHILSISLHISMKLTLGRNLVDTIDVIVDLVRHELFHNLYSLYLRKKNVRMYFRVCKLAIMVAEAKARAMIVAFVSRVIRRAVTLILNLFASETTCSSATLFLRFFFCFCRLGHHDGLGSRFLTFLVWIMIDPG